MRLVFLLSQGALMGIVAGEAFGGPSSPLFWAAILINGMLMAGYAITLTFFSDRH